MIQPLRENSLRGGAVMPRAYFGILTFWVSSLLQVEFKKGMLSVSMSREETS